MPVTKYATLLTAAAVKAAPALATDGQPIPNGVDRGTIWVRSTAGSGTMTVTLRCWLYEPTSAEWYPASVGTIVGGVNEAGVLNNGKAIEEVKTDALRHAEMLLNLQMYTRIDMEIVAVTGGTSVTVTAGWNRSEYN